MSDPVLSRDILELDWSDTALIAKVAAWLKEAQVSSLAIDAPDGQQLVIARGGADAKMTAVTHEISPAKTGTPVKAPFAGLFRASHPARAGEPLAREGRSIATRDILGFIETGMVLMAVRAPCEGCVQSLAATDGSLVGYGDMLMRIGEAS